MLLGYQSILFDFEQILHIFYHPKENFENVGDRIDA